MVNDFLSWSVFTPLARLSYCCYLIHMEVLMMFFGSALSFFPNDVCIC
jgi:peptidoglycan/LPS O-acetylase OafA/YrhL